MRFVVGILSLAATLCHAQAGGPPRPARTVEAFQVMHCLKTTDLDWLGNSPALERAKILEVGLRHDRKTYPGEDMVFVVVFEGPTRGDVFELTRKNHGRRRSYRIENNGEFKLRSGQVEWIGEILGGIWTHEYIEGNIKRIVRGPKTWVRVTDVLKPFHQVTCMSFVSNH